MTTTTTPLPFDGYRVIDVTTEDGYLCGSVLGELGADVIKVEPPGGDLGRRYGPFHGDDPHPEKSLTWWAFNTNKRGVTLKLDSVDGQVLFKRLAGDADFVVESFTPGYLDSLGLGYGVLHEINPRAILTSITPFGPKGPHSQWKANDLIVMATGGLMHIAGDADRAPVRVSVPHAHAQACMQAAFGTLIAHYHRKATGQGQHVDVSAQSAIVNTLIQLQQSWDISKQLGERGARTPWGPLMTRSLHKCKDGWVTWKWFVDKGRGRRNNGLLQWMSEEGADEGTAQWDFEGMTLYTMTQPQVDKLEDTVSRFFADKTRKEIYAQARKRRFLTFPVNDPSEILEDPQLASRRFFQAVEHPELGAAIRYPGALYQTTAGAYGIRRRPPLIGEHNDQVYMGELGLTQAEVTTLRGAGVV